MLEKSTFRLAENKGEGDSIAKEKLSDYSSGRVQAPTGGITPEQTHLPNLQLTKEEFAPVALSTFDRLDFNHDGNLDKNEIKHALDNPSTFDTSKTIQAIKIMYDQYQFLTDLSPRGLNPFEDKGPVITKEGLQKVGEICAGKTDPANEMLSSTNRTDYAKDFGIAGLLCQIPGSMAGTFMSFGLAYRLGLSAAARYALGTAGFMTGLWGPALVGGAIGYGIGYLLDKRHQQKSQKTEIAAFMNEFQQPS